MAGSACHFIVTPPSKQASMNRSYRIVFNRKTGIHQVASERAKSSGKGASARAVLGSGLAAVLLWGAGCAPAWSQQFLIVDTLPATTYSGGPLTVYGQALVGLYGTGQLNIENAAAISATQSYVGWDPNAKGTVILTGAGSSWTSGVMYVGYQGTGTVNVEAGGTVINDATLIGYDVGSQGTMTVSGSNSSLTSSAELSVGTRGAGTLNIEAGGTVQSAASYIGGGENDTVATSGNGTVNVNGTGSSFVNSLGLLVGNSSVGKLNIEAGATASAPAAYIGFLSGVSGALNVNGAGSLFTASNLTVGFLGEGALNIEAGGAVSSDHTSIGLRGGGIGSVSVNGTGSNWTNSTTLTVGEEGTGTLGISDGGSVFTDTLTLGDKVGGNGTVLLNGTAGRRGVLQTNQISKGAGTASLNWDGGTLRANANVTNVISGFAIGDVDVRSGGAFIDSNGYDIGLTTAGLLTGVGGLTKQGAGTLSLTGSNTYSGNTAVSDGTLLFDGYTQSASQTLGIGASSITRHGKLVVINAANFAADARIVVDVQRINMLAKDQILASVISAGTLNASTFNVSDNSALFNFRAAIHGNAVDLTVLPGVAVYDAVRNSGASAASDAAGVLDDVINNGATADMNVVVTALGSLATQDDVGRAVTQTLPALNSGVTQVGKNVLNSINHLVQNRQSGGNSGLSGGDDFSNRSAWLTPFGSRADQDDRDGVSGFNATTWGLAGGIEGDLSKTTRLGIAYAYANSKVDGNTSLSGTQQHVDIYAHVLALYGTTELANGMTLGFQGDIGQNNNDGSRHIHFGGFDRTATSDYKTYTAHVGLSLKKILALNARTSLTPSIRADYTWLQDESYREQGADALNLDVAKHSSDAFVLGADARISHVLTARSRIEGYTGIAYDTINNPGNVVSSYAGMPGQVFGTQGIEHSPWLFAGGIGYIHNTAGGTEISVRYDVEGRSDYTNQSASVKAKWAF
jgi:T5SS/PEP-CTERM-associated repeat protein/autotransporter-associated beta strand protein